MKSHEVGGAAILLVALLVAIPLAWSSESRAQVDPQTSLPATGGTQQIQGVIQNVDPFERVLTLNDGTEFTIPPALDIPQEILKEWAIVKVNFVERDGKKVVTSLEAQQLEVQQSSV